MKSKIAVGDRVAYSARWLKSVGIHTGDIPFARGTVLEIMQNGQYCQIAAVDWGEQSNNCPYTVNVTNLAKVGTPAMNSN